MAWWKILLIAIAVLITGGIGVAWYVMNYVEFDIYVPMFADNCASCHGEQLDGTAQGPALVGVGLRHGDTVAAMQDSIRKLHPQLGQPAFAETLTDVQTKGLAIYIGERRMGQRFTEFQFSRDLVVPDGELATEEHSFRIETVVDGLSPLIFSIEPMPDGSLLVTEKERGLSVVSPEGVQSPLIEGTPALGSSVDVMGIQYGWGWLLDVALHPDYEENGWVYLHYTDLCEEECEGDLVGSASMNRVDRAHIVDGKWVDVQTIWQAPREFYARTADTGAGGRLTFDDDGHVFLSVGIKLENQQDMTPQDLTNPYGKIHRVNDDGSIPVDNPYAASPNGALPSIWTYGHRSPQGLEWHAERKRAWNSEMGARGGDELNELKPGRNYGWPFHSLGLEYEGVEVARYKRNALEFDDTDVEQTLVDITPSPAISSFVFYEGNRFPAWQDNVLIGSLKGCSLYRMVFDGNKLVHRETLISDLARIRDVEIGYDGLPYLLLENESGSRIVRLVPAEPAVAAR